MKILWFSLTPSMATEYVTGKPGIGNGWVESMEKIITNRIDVQLGLIFPGETDKLEKFHLGNTQYYKYPKQARTSGKIARIIENYQNKISDDSDVQYFLECIEDFQPDIVHIFGTERNFGLILPNVNIPVLIWIQGVLTVYTHMWFNGINRRDVLKYSPAKNVVKGESHLNKFYIGEKLAQREQFILKHAKYLLGRTAWDRRVASVLAPQADYYHCDEVMRDVFYQVEWKPKEGRQKLVLMTTIQDNLYKGLETIFGTAQLLDQLLAGQFEWRIAGLSQKHDLLKIVEGKFQLKAESININPLERIPANQLIEELLNADIFVHPSHIDNSPNSVCEAMTIGMPIVSSNAGGIPDILENKEEGLLVQPGDIWAFAGAILELHKDPAQSIRIGQNAMNRARVRHNPESIVATLVDISKTVLEKRKQ